ncbi:hypothetical protein LY76DRAFT_120874 [Colletotrichum caudatum]|nr:hypothetical protein LY76DRAFT_120874 [Colletotrichum caudatum]
MTVCEVHAPSDRGSSPPGGVPPSLPATLNSGSSRPATNRRVGGGGGGGGKLSGHWTKLSLSVCPLVVSVNHLINRPIPPLISPPENLPSLVRPPTR